MSIEEEEMECVRRDIAHSQGVPYEMLWGIRPAEEVSGWASKSADEIVADVNALVERLKNEPIHPSPPIVIELCAFRGPEKFRNRKEKKRWAVGLQRMFSDMRPPIHATLGQWKKFMEGADLPPADHEVIVNLEGVLHV